MGPNPDFRVDIIKMNSIAQDVITLNLNLFTFVPLKHDMDVVGDRRDFNLVYQGLLQLIIKN